MFNQAPISEDELEATRQRRRRQDREDAAQRARVLRDRAAAAIVPQRVADEVDLAPPRPAQG